MPEGLYPYPDRRAAAKLAGLSIVSDRRPLAAAPTGPDMLFCYRVWRRAENRGENLPLIGERLQREHRRILQSLIENAQTPASAAMCWVFWPTMPPTALCTPMWCTCAARAALRPTGRARLF